MNNKSNKNSRFITIMVVVCLLALIGAISNSCHSSYSTPYGEVRCWYCSRVIFNHGRPIHCKHKYLYIYACDYCGKSNAIKE